MASLNKVMLIGNLTRDPEVRYTPKGSAVTDIGIAINRRYRVEDETREEVTFVDVTFWGRQAETIGQYMKKGRPIFIEGRLQLDSWEDKNTGQKRSRLRVVGENFQFLGGRDDAGGGGGGGDGGGFQQRAPDPPPYQQQQNPAPGGAPSGSDSDSANGGGGGNGPGSSINEEDESDDIPF